MNTNTNHNAKNDSFSKTPWGPIAFVLTAMLTIMVLMPTSFAKRGYLTEKIAPANAAVSAEQTSVELSDQWKAKTETITFDHMYRNAR